MDFHNLKRRELQALCKKHKIPANLTNLEMAEKLTALLTVNEKPLTRGRRSCLKVLDENVSENEFDVENGPAKKVRFSPENEMIEFEKSEVRYLEMRGRGRRKSMMFKDKGSGGVGTSRNDGVNEDVRELRRSRRGKILEGSEAESKGGKRAKKVDTSRDNSIADDMVNGEVREVRKSRRGKLSEGKEVGNKGGKMAKQLNVLEDNGIVDNGEVREVRRSRKGKLSEGSEVEIRRENRVTKVDALDHNGIADDVLNGKVREVRRSRRGKVTKGSDALKGNLTSSADNGPSLDLLNEENIVVKKIVLYKRGVVDKEKRENEDVKMGSRKKGASVRNLRSRKEEDHEDVAGTKEAVTEAACVHHELAVRRSNRHVGKVDYVQLVNENASKNKNFSCGMVDVKEGSPVEANLSGSKRNASKPECPISMQGSDVITITNSKKQTKKRRKDAILEGEAARIDEGKHNERSFRQTKCNTKRKPRVITTAKREKVAQKERGRSKKTNIGFEDSSTEDIPTAAAHHDAQASSSEGPENTVCNNCNNDDLSANVPDSGSTVPTESNFLIEGQDFGTASGTFFDHALSPLTENAVQKQGETSARVERNEGNDSKTTLYIRTPLVEENNSLALQNNCMDSALECANVELDKQHGVMAENTLSVGHSVSLCKSMKEKAKFESFDGKEREQLNLEEHNSSELENPLTLIDVCEVATSYVDNECASEAIQNTSIKADESKQEEFTSKMHPMKKPMQREESIPMQMNDCGPHYLSSAVPNFEHIVLSSFKDSKSDENGNSKIECNNSEELWEHKSLDDAFRRSATRIQLDGDDNSSEDVIFPSDMPGEVLVSTPPSAKAVETAIEFSGSIYASKRVESPKPTFTLEADEEPLKALETNSDMCTQSPSEPKRGVDAELNQDEHLAESSKHEEVGQLKPLNDGLDHSLESPELNFSTMQYKDGPDNGNSVAISDGPDHSLQSHELNSSARTKFSVTQDQDLPDGGDSVSSSDAQGVVLCLSTEDTQIVVAGKGTEIELSSTAGANTENNHFLLTADNMPNQGYGDCSEAKIKEESVSVETLFMMRTPSTGDTLEESVAGIEKCTMSINKNLKWVADTLEDQTELMTEGLEKRIYDCEDATNPEMQEANIGQEDEPVKVEKRNSNELKSPYHLIAATEDVREDPGFAYGSKLSPLGGTNIQNEGAFTDIVDSDKHSELRMQLSKQRTGVHGDFPAEIHKHSEEGQIFQEKAESEEAGHLMEQQNGFDDCLLHNKLNSSVISKLSMVQDQGISDSDTVERAESCGVISSPPDVATQIVGGRCTEIELSARKSSSMSSSPLSIFKFQPVGTGSKHCLSTDDNAQNQGHEACFEEGGKEEADSVRALSILQTSPTGKDDGLERSDILMDGRSYGVIELVNDELGSLSEGMEPKANCVRDCKAAIERKTQESGNGKEGEPFNQETSNTIEAEVEAVRCAIEVETIGTIDGCPSNAAYTALKYRNENGQEDAPKVPFGISINNHENDTVQAPDSVALHDPISHVADRDGSVFKESDGALLQCDEQNIDDFKVQREIHLGEEASKDNSHEEFGAEVHMLSSEIKIPPAESKGDDSFPFDQTKDAEEVTGTSLAMLFETQGNMSQMNTEEMIVTDSNCQDLAASESSISKDQLVFKESEVSHTMIDYAGSESVETMTPSAKNPRSTLQSYLLTGVAELVQLIEPEAGSVEEPVGAAGKNNPPLNKQMDQGLVQTETKSISGIADHQCTANADRVAAREQYLDSDLKTDSTQNKNADRGAAAGESISSVAKYTAKRKNARTILIHGTPNKLQMAAHMKENAPSSKLEKVGTLTSVRPVAKRSALKHLPWK